MSTNTCRFCHDWKGEMVKYGIRHYAHPQCGLGAQGLEWLRKVVSHPGLRWRMHDYSVGTIVALLPLKDHTLAARTEIEQLLGRNE